MVRDNQIHAYRIIHNGVVRSLGIILNDVTSELGTSTTFTATAITISASLPYWMGLVNTPLSKRFSRRQLVMAGGLISSLGLSLSAFTKNGVQFAVTVSLFGVGYSTVALISTSAPAVYFPDMFEAASSIAVIGGPLGLVLLPLLFETLYQSLGWRGALFLLGAINSHSIAVGALLQQPSEKIPSSTERSSRGKRGVESLRDVKHFQNVRVVGQAREVSTNLSGNCNLAYTPDGEQDEAYESRELPVQTLVSRSKGPLEDTDTSECQDTNINAPDTNTVAFPTTTNCNNPAPSTSVVSPQEKRYSRFCSGCRAVVRYFDLHLLKDYPAFAVFCVAVFLFSLTDGGILLFLIPNAIAKGLVDYGVYISIVEGVGEVLGGMVPGIIAVHSKKLRIHKVYLLTCILAAAALFLNFIANTFWFVAVLSDVSADPIPLPPSNASSLVSRWIGEWWSSLLLNRGTSVEVKLPRSIYDRTQSYDIAFVVLGVTISLSGMIVFIVYSRCFRRSPSLPATTRDATHSE
ncbi:uncharacterized protein [Diadema antillarum]|uniref:uncharacterized protein n=1 Tax=Diadema antillarum TaxID=105358 RepID=UPI003A875B34